jgi:hypothetical protein
MIEDARATHNNLPKLFQFAFVVEATYCFFLDWSLVLWVYRIVCAAVLGRGLSDPTTLPAWPATNHAVAARQRAVKATVVALPAILLHLSYAHSWPTASFLAPNALSAVTESTSHPAGATAADALLVRVLGAGREQQQASTEMRAMHALSASSILAMTFAVDPPTLLWLLVVDALHWVLAFLMISADASDSAFRLFVPTPMAPVDHAGRPQHAGWE